MEYSIVGLDVEKDLVQRVKEAENANANRVIIGNISMKKFELKVVDNEYVIQYYIYNYEELRPVESGAPVHMSILTSGKLKQLGYSSLYFRHTQLYRYINGIDKTLVLWTIEKTLVEVVMDRIRLLLYGGNHGTGYVNGRNGILRDDIEGVMRSFIRLADKPNTLNRLRAIQNRLTYIAPAELIDGKPVGWTQQTHRAMGDALRKSHTIPNDTWTYLGQHLRVDPSNAESVRKGTFVCLDPALLKLRGFKVDATRAPGHFIDDKGMQYTLFSDVQLCERNKMALSDGFPACEINETYKDEKDGEPLFHLHKQYLKTAKDDLDFSSTEVNLLVGFAPNDPELEKYKDINTFFATDKDIVNRSLAGIDGSIPISSAICDKQYVRTRVFNRKLYRENFVPEFRTIIDHITKNDSSDEIKIWENCKENPIAIELKCIGECGETMYPISHTADEHGKYTFYCPRCQATEQSPGHKIRLISSGHAEIHDFHEQFDQEKDGVRNFVTAEIVMKVRDTMEGNRIVDSSGAAKGVLVRTNPDMVGATWINGKRIPLAGLIYSNSNKGKDGAIEIAQERLRAALANEVVFINDHLMNSADANNYFNSKNFEKRVVERIALNHKTGKLEHILQDMWIGLISIKVTEESSEFSRARSENTKLSFQVQTNWDMLGENELRKEAHRYSVNQPGSLVDVHMVNELISIFQDKDKEIVPMVKTTAGFTAKLGEIAGFNAAKDPKKIPILGLDDVWDVSEKAKIIQSYLTQKQWVEAKAACPLFTNPLYVNGIAFRIKVGDNTYFVRFPSNSLINKRVTPCPDGNVYMTEYVTSVFRMLMTLAVLKKNIKNNTKDTSIQEQFQDNIDAYKSHIGKEFVGKWGALPVVSNLRRFIYNSKEIGCHLLLAGVTVIVDSNVINSMRHKAVEAGLCSYDNRYKFPLYGIASRDPHIWPLQSTTVVEIWDKHRANVYFKEHYGFYFDHPDHPEESYYPGIKKGQFFSVIDMAILTQSDADGDLRRTWVPFDFKVQTLLQNFWVRNKNYDYFDPSKITPDMHQYYIVQATAAWHHKYLVGECADKHNKDTLTYTVNKYPVEMVTSMVVDNVKKKGNIAEITNSMRHLITMCYILEMKGEMTRQERDELICLYQMEFLQDGCIRSMKHKAAFEALTLDKIGRNDFLTIAGDANNQVAAREYILRDVDSEANRLLKLKLFARAEQYIKFKGWYMTDKGWKKGEITEDGYLVLALSNFVNGGRSGLIDSAGRGVKISIPALSNALKMLKSPIIKDSFYGEVFESLILD